MVPMAKKPAPVMALVTRPRRMASGMNGSRALRSRIANSAHSTAEPTNSAPIGQDNQRKCVPPQSSANSRLTAAAIISSTPGMSSRCGRSLRGKCRSARPVITSAAAPSGRLIQKINDQCRWSVSTPPSTGPRMLALMNTTEV